MGVRCELCQGYGHRAQKCATRYALDAAAKQLEVGWEWGAAKSCGYYLEYTNDPQNQVEIAKDAKNAVESKFRKIWRTSRPHGYKGHKCRRMPLF